MDYRYNLGFIISLFVALTSAVRSQEAIIFSDGKISSAQLSDGLLETGTLEHNVQQIFDPVNRKISRRHYEYFNFFKDSRLIAIWHPNSLVGDRAGRISGSGRIVWRERNKALWDPDGVIAVYSGAVRDGKANGLGKLITNEGLIYDGSWSNGHFHGVGRLRLANGEEFFGEFKRGIAEGNGRGYEITGEVFEGQYKHGYRDGVGRTKLPSGFTYSSKWHAGVEEPGSRKIRLAQIGGPDGVGGGNDVRLGVSVFEKPRLPKGVEVTDVVPYHSVNSSSGDEIQIAPDDQELLSVWKGRGDIVTTITSDLKRGFFDVDERYINAVPPTLVISIENHSLENLTISGIDLEVKSSVTDYQPAVQMVDDSDASCGDAFGASYKLENYGWSPAKNAWFAVKFGSHTASMRKPIGDLSSQKEISFESELKEVGVKVERLKQIGDSGFPCPKGKIKACLESLRSNDLFGSLGPNLHLHDSRIIVEANGTLNYKWSDNEGSVHERNSPFHADVGLGKFVEMAECGEGGVPTPPHIKPIRLQLDRQNYTIPVDLKRTVKSHEKTQLLVPIDAAKSSNHAFRVVANLSDGRQIRSRFIKLLYFRPRS